MGQKWDFLVKLRCYFGWPIVPHHALTFQRSNFFQWFWANLVPNSPFAQKEDFFGESTDNSSAELLSPITLQIFQKISAGSHKIQRYVILSKIEPKLPICLNIFWKKFEVTFVYLFCSILLQFFKKLNKITFVSLLSPIMLKHSKKILRVDN